LKDRQIYSLKFLWTGTIGDVLWPLLGGAALLLIVACVNVAGLMLIRGFGRRREIAIRVALGAQRRQIAGYFLQESLIVSLLGGLLALPLSVVALSIFKSLAPAEYTSRLQPVALDVRVLLFALGIVVFAAVISGLIPAIVSASPTPQMNLRGPANARIGVGQGGRGLNAQNLLLAAQAGAATILLVGAVLLIRSLWIAIHEDPGFDPRNATLISEIQTAGFERGQLRSDRRREFEVELLRAAKSLPMVESAALGNMDFNSVPELPISAGNAVPDRMEDWPTASWWDVTPEFFTVLNIRLLQGRFFSDADGPNSRAVVLINQELARTFFHGANPLGQSLSYSNDDQSQKVVRAEIIGLVGDTKMAGLARPVRPEVYTCIWQDHNLGSLVVRSSAPLSAVNSAVRQKVLGISSDFAIESVEPIERIISESSIARPRFLTSLLSAFALLALALTVVAVFGAVSFNVVRRTRDIGIRMALGAQRGDVLRSVLRDALAAVTIGLAAGIAGALALTNLIRAWLYGVAAADPLTFVASSLLILLVCAIASYLPARRAMRVDPMVALRYE
jgi:putative ABC transport system permease protein